MQHFLVRRALKKTDFASKCNCRNKVKYPVREECLQTATVYQANIISEGKPKSHFVLCQGQFKLRYNNHLKTLRNNKYEVSTELSKYIWKFNDRDKPFDILSSANIHVNE